MLQHKFTKLFTILTVTTGLNIITPELTYFEQTAIVNADATSLPADGTMGKN